MPGEITLIQAKIPREGSGPSASASGRVPQRTCVGCRRVSPKNRLVRLVRTVDDRVIVDKSGKEAGRGAYLCAVYSCWVEGIGRGRLERALRMKLDPQTTVSLEAYAVSHAAKEVPAQGS